jgi:hypothetical protein
MKVWHVTAGLMLALLLAGCGSLVPARVPPQLTHTPGPPVIVTDHEVRTVAFRAQYPRGWQVITGPAFADPWVIFLNPDQTALIVLALDPADTAVNPPGAGADVCRLDDTIHLAESQQIIVAVLAADGTCDPYVPVYRRMVDSLRPGTDFSDS